MQCAIEICSKYGGRDIALKLVEKIGSYEERIRAFLVLG